MGHLLCVRHLLYFALCGSFSQFPVSLAHAWSIEKSTGEVSLQRQRAKFQVKEATKLKTGDVLETFADAKMALKDGESELWMGPSTRLRVTKIANPDNDIMGRFDLIKGRIRAKFKRPSGPEVFPYDIKTRSLIVSVRGTEFLVEDTGIEEKVCTLEGLVRVNSAKVSAESWDVSAAHGLFVKPREMPKVFETSAEQAKTWLDSTSF